MSEGKQKKDRSLGFFHGEAATQAAGEAGNAYGPASLVAAGADVQGVGMLTTITNLAAVFLYLKVPTIIGKIGSRKKAVLIMSFIDAVGWLPLIAILLFLRPLNPLWLIPFWVINLVPGMLVNAARDSWMADIVPANSLGRYFSIRTAISGAMYLASYYVMGYMLNMLDSRILYGFALIFILAFSASFISFLIYSIIHDPNSTAVEKKPGLSVFSFVREMKSGKMGRFILFVSLLHFTVYISSPFVAIYLLSDLQFNYLAFALVTSSEFIAKILTVTFWGKYADRVGNLKVLGIVSFMIPVVPLFWLVSPPIAICLVLVQLFSGVAWAGFDLCSANFIYQNAPAKKRLGYIVYHKALSTLAKALGALAGAYLIYFIHPIFGYKTLGLFLLSGILRFVVVTLLFKRLTRVLGNIFGDEQSSALAKNQTSALNRGLLHQPQEWAMFSRAIKGKMPVIQSHISSETVPVRRGLLHRPKEWSQLRNTLAYEISAVDTHGETPCVAAGRSLFYKPQEWAKFSRAFSCNKHTIENHTEVAAERGLLYRPNAWAQFGKSVASKVNLAHRIQRRPTLTLA